MKTLTVYCSFDEVGSLVQDDDGLLIFQYASSWLSRQDAVPLSRSLPLTPDPFRGNRARPFFAGILPEEEPRRQVAAILGISERNDFAMLERVGGECAGAVCLLPGSMSPPVRGETTFRELTERELEEVMTELHRRPLMAGREGIRLSLAGAQNKLPIVMQGSRVALPLGDTPSTHIIKPEPDRFPGLVANELLCMTLAGSIGLNVPSATLRRVGTRPCILVQRYDRMKMPDGTIVRIHQEDFCQALGCPPERKYQAEGGPLVRDCVAMLRDWSTAPVLDIRDFIDGVFFNILVGNADAHAKNYSLLYQRGQRRLAPFYDIVCTLAWPELSKTPAMKIGHSDSIATVTPLHWQKLAQETRLSWPMLRERMVELAEKTLRALDEPSLRKVAGDDTVFEHVAGIISERAVALLRGL